MSAPRRAPWLASAQGTLHALRVKSPRLLLLPCLLLGIAPACDDGGGATRVDPPDRAALDIGLDDLGVGDATPDAAPPVDAAPPLDAAAVDAAPMPDAVVPEPPRWACPPPWSPADDVGCAAPDALPDCPADTLPLPSGGCSPPWACPAGWAPVSALGPGCAPPPLPDCAQGSLALPTGCSDPWRCPPGWQALDDGFGCRPAYGDCLAGVRPLADGGCAEDPPCVDAPGPAAIHVDAAAPDGGDGSAARPFNRLADAVAPGAEVRLAAGEYLLGALPAGARLIGACGAEVRLTRRLDVAAGGGVERVELLDGVHVRGGDLVGARLTVRGFGVQVDAGSATLSDLWLPETTAQGLRITDGARIEGERWLIERSIGAAILLRGEGTSGTLTDVVVRDPQPNADGGAKGVAVEEGADLRINGALIQGALGVGLDVNTATVTAERLALVATQPRANAGADRGWAIRADDAAVLRLADGWIDRARVAGLLVDRGSLVEGSRLAIQDVQPAPDQTAGYGVAVDDESTAIVNGLVIARVHEAAVRVSGAAEAEIRRGLVSGVRPSGPAPDLPIERQGDPAFGQAVAADGGTRVRLDGVVARDTVGVALALLGESEVHGLVLDGVEPLETRDGPRLGTGIFSNASLRASDVHLRRARGAAIFLIEGAEALLERIDVADTAPNPGQVGFGILSDDADLTVIDAHIDRSVWHAIEARAPQTRLERIVVTRTRTIDGPLPAGQGVAIARGHGTIRGLTAIDNGTSGLLVADGATADAQDVWVHLTAPRAVTHAINGASVLAIEGARLTLQRAHLGRNQAIGLAAIDPGTRVDATDVVVADAVHDGLVGFGVGADAGGALQGERIWVEGVQGFGIVVGTDAQVTLEATLVRDMARLANGGQGEGIAQLGGQLTVSDVLVEAAWQNGFALVGAGAQLTGRRLTVRGTRPGLLNRGNGVLAGGQTRVDLTDFALVDNPRRGLGALDAQIALLRGLIRGSQVGLTRQFAAQIRRDAVRIDGVEQVEICEGSCYGAPEPERVERSP